MSDTKALVLTLGELLIEAIEWMPKIVRQDTLAKEAADAITALLAEVEQMARLAPLMRQARFCYSRGGIDGARSEIKMLFDVWDEIHPFVDPLTPAPEEKPR